MDNIIAIHVPNLNDSYSRVVLERKVYWIRFTYNSISDNWSFGIYSAHREPIAVGLRIVPSFLLNLQVVNNNFPPGDFAVSTGLERIGRDDFNNGNAVFVYIPKGADSGKL